MIDLSHFTSFFIANCKLNGSFQFIDNFTEFLKVPKTAKKCITLCPPNLYLNYLKLKKGDFKLGAQDCSYFDEGAYTGEISAKMLVESQVEFCIVGHSERRQYFNESNQIVRQKADKLIKNNIIPIICIGETLDQKNQKITNQVLKNQIYESVPEISNNLNTIIAYEPIWAIGTGLTPTLEEIKNSHNYIRNLDKKFLEFKILYGGSVNAKNSKQLMGIEGVDGALIGGSSLKVDVFNEIIS